MLRPRPRAPTAPRTRRRTGTSTGTASPPTCSPSSTTSGSTVPSGFGHSCGGAALLLAEEARPGTFAGLYCFEPIVYPGDDPPGADHRGQPAWPPGALRRRQKFASRRQALENFAGKAPFDRLDPDALAAYVDNGFAPVEGRRHPVALPTRARSPQVFAHALSHDAYARLAEVRCPVTLACGADTDAIGPAALERFAQRLDQSTVVVCPAMGHFGPLEDPAARGGLGAHPLVPALRYTRGVAFASMTLALPRSLSPSKLSAFKDCPLAFRFAAIDRLPEAPAPHMVKGTLVHSALERLFWDHPRGERTPDAAHGASRPGVAGAAGRPRPRLVWS